MGKSQGQRLASGWHQLDFSFAASFFLITSIIRVGPTPRLSKENNCVQRKLRPSGNYKIPTIFDGWLLKENTTCYLDMQKCRLERPRRASLQPRRSHSQSAAVEFEAHPGIEPVSVPRWLNSSMTSLPQPRQRWLWVEHAAWLEVGSNPMFVSNSSQVFEWEARRRPATGVVVVDRGESAYWKTMGIGNFLGVSYIKSECSTFFFLSLFWANLSALLLYTL